MGQGDESDRGKRTGSWMAGEVFRPEVAAMLESGQSPDQIVFALLMVAYDVFMGYTKERPGLARIAMFMELAK